MAGIVIDATSLLLPSAGVKNYVHYWIRTLMAESGPHTISLFPLLRAVPPLDHQQAARGFVDLLRVSVVRFLNLRGNPAGAFWPMGVDIFHASQHLLNPPRGQKHLTSTIYDFTCWLLPHTHQEENIVATKRYASVILKSSDACIAISESARQDALSILRIPPERIVTIYPGVADDFFDPPAADRVRQVYNLQKPYFLYVGTIEPRKGVETILDAYAKIRSGIRDSCELVLAGMYGWRSEQVRKRLSNAMPGVRYLGYIPEQTLPALTAGAVAVVFPSVYEGFGFPVAQGMAAGVPVITSYGSSLEEIADGACLLVTPGKSDELAAAMEAVADSADLRATLSARGRTRAEAFRWNVCARKSLDFFTSVAGG